jgi:calcium-dependent protein kinase
MLNQNPKDRYNADLLLKSPWFRDTSVSFSSACSNRMNLLDLIHSRKLNDFQRIILTHISSTTTKFVQWRKLHKSFSTIDSNHDGVISKDELINAYVENDISIANIDEIFDSIDTDGDGKIQFSEFQAAFTKMSDVPEDCLKSVFDAYDRDHDEFINLEELGEMFENKDEEFKKKIEFLMREIDDDEDGKISFEEFKTYLQSISNSIVR